jgi:hypothetical protein
MKTTTHKLEKSTNKTAGRYFYRGVYIQKTFGGAGWHAHCCEQGLNLPVGLSAKTLGMLQILIDHALDGAQ